MKELGRLEGQLAGLRQELAALTLKQSSVEDQVGLLPQQLQAVRDDVSWNPLVPREYPSSAPVLGVCEGECLLPLLWAQTLAFSDGSSSRFLTDNMEGCSSFPPWPEQARASPPLARVTTEGPVLTAWPLDASQVPPPTPHSRPARALQWQLPPSW